MVLKRRLDNEFNGYEFPPIPRAARSARRRVPFKKQFQENQMCAFDLLAVVAGKLLLEKDSTLHSRNIVPNDESAVNEVCEIEEKTLVAKVDDLGSPAKSFFVSELLHEVPDENHCHKESLYSKNDFNLGLASATTASGCKEKFDADKVVSEEVKSAIGTSSSKVEVGFSGNFDDSIDAKVEGQVAHNLKDEPSKSGKLANETCGGMFGSESTLSAHHIPHCSYPANRDNVNIVSSRDDDENSSGCTHPSTMKRFVRRTPRIGDRRIKKILASRCWKVASRLKDSSCPNRQGDLKPFYHTGKNYCKLDRSERLYPIKKRRRLSYSSPSNSVGMIDTGLAQKGCNGDSSANGYRMSSSSAVKQSSFQPRDSQVKLRIKSFRVPELFIEIPETATIGSLKRTVVDAFTALLGGGVRVGVLLQGRKVRDDNKTLLQTGISRSNHSEALGFSLEPNPSHSNGSVCSGDLTSSVSCQPPQPLGRYPHIPSVVHQGTSAASPEPQMVSVGNLVESDHDSAPFPTDTLIAQSTSDPKALLAAPAMNAAADALAVVAANRRSKRAEMAQRRIRRPFSVAEVEALVQAVEKLGTGRWRDVKVRAFDHAKHRTYVDLKDKWKTLVHTARISPQQRRGEPVPQELLDRVLAAHAYWSNQQQQQLNQQPADSCTVPSPLVAMP